MKSHEISEEIISDVFISLWNNRAKLDNIANIEAYLFSSVKYKCINYHRDHKNNLIQHADFRELSIFSKSGDPSDQLLHKELIEKVIGIIDNLPPRCKLIFEMVKDEGMKYREVATLLGISIKAVEAQVSKAMVQIRKDIFPYLNDSDFKRYLNENKLKYPFLSILLQIV